MTQLPEEVSSAWEKKDGPVVLTTVDLSGTPNSIYATCVKKYDESTLVVADNYFDKTRKNILTGSRAAILFITGDKTAYQVKGSIALHTSGKIYDDMKEWNPQKHPGRAAAVLTVEEVYSGSIKLA
ncbi:MAG TPA: pyridoxamine 5'-phosphate oxidase family protein [Spirochaetota bacterium]|nr:pyridoxamine 5'-phosphate oxidase family protein [Spirochaetota bacterium]HPI89578.1 pyridoxamine 5'-phosphate oxidase family protein [Spirochaetota bacterium]HPR49042.1 pyridoxamine 5'-phosphate oxidase family protein [Spirochaetota bacterium]